jgi:L-threonylcarbamoyladenylate synthase
MVAGFMNLAIYATDTVWGIGGLWCDREAIARVAEIKNISFDKPTTLLFPSVKVALDWIELPQSWNLDWLQDFFSLETSLAVPRKHFKRELPYWITFDSPYLAFRCLELEWIEEIYSEMEGPMTTTSLNRTGEPPILSYTQALAFQQKYCPNIAVYPKREVDLSSQSSTMVCWDGEEFQLWREGALVQKVKEHVGL